MNKEKGFTLIEIIGVVTVLALILIVAVPSLTKTLKRNEQNRYNDFVSTYEMAAENYVIDKLQDGQVFNDNMVFSMGDLIDAGYIKELITNPETNEKITREYKISVTREADGTFKYELFNPNILSAEYQQVEYIESTGTQYILTNIIPDNQTGVKAEWSFYENQDQTVILGTGNFWFGYQDAYLAFGWNDLIYSDAMPFETKIEVKLNYMNNRLYGYDYEIGITGESSMTTINEVLSEQTYPIGIFAANGQNITNHTSIKLYSFEITYEDKIIANFVPCYRKADGVIGLFDKENQIFYTNQGTGTFLKGADV